jgi:hypothetical protein
MKTNIELLLCAQVNFENFARAVPGVAEHPYWQIAMAQLEEALGGKTVEEILIPTVKENRNGIEE